MDGDDVGCTYAVKIIFLQLMCCMCVIVSHGFDKTYIKLSFRLGDQQEIHCLINGYSQRIHQASDMIGRSIFQTCIGFLLFILQACIGLLLFFLQTCIGPPAVPSSGERQLLL